MKELSDMYGNTVKTGIRVRKVLNHVKFEIFNSRKMQEI